MNAHRSLYIHGEWLTGYGKSFDSIDPATGEKIWSANGASPSDVGRAVRAAKTAFPRWSATPVEERIETLNRYKQILEERKEELATSISMETGKPLWESRGEVAAMIGKIPISIEAYDLRTGVSTREHPAGLSVTRHLPHGAIAVLGPLNFPGHLPNGHIVPALLAGNTIVLKPSEQCPFVAEKMVTAWIDAGLPPGVLNLVQGGRAVGKSLIDQSGIDGLFFTGSWKAGKIFLKKFNETPSKILALEMGGNNPLVIGSISDIKAAAYNSIQSAFITSGQRCTCARRLILPRGKENDEFLDLLIEMTGNLAVGFYDDNDPEPFMGPVINEGAALHLLSVQASLQGKGGKALLLLKHEQENTGFVKPGIIDVTKVSKREDIEIFGPLLQVIRVNSYEDALKEANNTEFGLAAGLFSDDVGQYEQFYRTVRAGCVNWNAPLTGASSAAPFGGIGKSGNHRPSALYAADYCAYPVASIETETLKIPEKLTPGVKING